MKNKVGVRWIGRVGEVEEHTGKGRAMWRESESERGRRKVSE